MRSLRPFSPKPLRALQDDTGSPRVRSDDDRQKKRRHPPVPPSRECHRGPARPSGRSFLRPVRRRQLVYSQGRAEPQRSRHGGHGQARVRRGDRPSRPRRSPDRSGRREAEGRQGRLRLGGRRRHGPRRRDQQHLLVRMAAVLRTDEDIPGDRSSRMVRAGGSQAPCQASPDDAPRSAGFRAGERRGDFPGDGPADR